MNYLEFQPVEEQENLTPALLPMIAANKQNVACFVLRFESELLILLANQNHKPRI